MKKLETAKENCKKEKWLNNCIKYKDTAECEKDLEAGEKFKEREAKSEARYYKLCKPSRGYFMAGSQESLDCKEMALEHYEEFGTPEQIERAKKRLREAERERERDNERIRERAERKEREDRLREACEEAGYRRSAKRACVESGGPAQYRRDEERYEQEYQRRRDACIKEHGEVSCFLMLN